MNLVPYASAFLVATTAGLFVATVAWARAASAYNRCTGDYFLAGELARANGRPGPPRLEEWPGVPEAEQRLAATKPWTTAAMVATAGAIAFLAFAMLTA